MKRLRLEVKEIMMEKLLIIDKVLKNVRTEAVLLKNLIGQILE